MPYKFSITALALLFAGCATKAPAEPAAPVEPVVEAEPAPAPAPAPASSATAAADVQWKPVFPDQPDGPMMSLVSGNPKEGGFSAIVKLPAGHASDLHSHPANLTGVVFSGTVTNGRTAEEAAEISAGSMWIQPGNEVHFTGCTEEADCIFVGHMDGPMGRTASENAAEASTMVVTASSDVGFEPINPEQPQGPGMVTLTGDRATGPFTALVSFPAGATSPLHSHAATYSGIVVSGVIGDGDSGELGVGSHWTRVAEEVHQTGCSGEESCVFYVSMEGAFSMTPAEAPADAEAPAEEAPAEDAAE